MKKLFLFAAAFAAVLAITGCTTTHTNDGTVVAAPIVKPTEYKADYAIAQKQVSGEASVNCLFGFITWGPNSFADNAFVCCKSGFPFFFLANSNQLAKQGAVYNACAAAKADYLLGAKYKVDTTDYFVFKTIKCKATGFPATLKSVK